MEFFEKKHMFIIIGIIALLCLGIVVTKFPVGSDNEQSKEPQKEVQQEEEEEEVKRDENGAIIVSNPDDIQVVVNKSRSLPEGYTPDDLVVPNVLFAFSGTYEKSYLRQEAATALEKLFDLAEEDGITLYAVSGFRSYERQVEIFNNNVSTKGEQEAEAVSAHPGQSEHQTGLTMDVSSISNNSELTEAFGETEEGKWLAENAYRAGFIIRYLQGAEDITGYSYEPWHIRYVGDIAKEIHEQGITLEEYMGLMSE